jgi:hypothetical protein
MTCDTPSMIRDADSALRTSCPSCDGDHTISYRNREGHLYCRCLRCAVRFWAA